MTVYEALQKVCQFYSLRVGQVIHTLYGSGDIFYVTDDRLLADLQHQYSFAFKD